MSQLTTSVSADWCCRLSPCALQKPSWHRPSACWICALPCPPYELTKGVVNYWLRNCMMYSFFSAYHCTFKMNPYQRELLWRTIVAVTQMCYAGIECFEYNICVYAVCVWSSSLRYVLPTLLSSLLLLFHLASHQQKGPLMSLILLKVCFSFFLVSVACWGSGFWFL